MLDRGGINSLIRLIHTIVNEKFLHFSRGSGGTGTPPVPPETMKNHPLDPDPGPHTGTLPEDKVVFEGAGHPHSGGAGGKKVTAADVVNVPAGGIAATNVQGALDELDGEKTGLPVAEGDVTFDDVAGHDHQGAGNTGKKVDYTDLANKEHGPSHEGGGGDPVDVKDLPDGEGRLLTGVQKTDLTDGGATVLHAHAGDVTAAVKIILTNQTGSERSINDVVVTDPDHDESFIGTSGSGYQGKVLVVAETIGTSGSGPCWERGGPFNINVVGAVNRNDGLRTSATIYKAEAAPSVVSDGVFAIALSTSGSGGGTVRAVFLDVIGAGGGDGGGGDGAPIDAQYLALALDGDLTAERVLVPVDGLRGVDGGANANYRLSSGLPHKATPDDPPDDEFDQGAGGLDGKWTAVAGGSGVVNLLETGNVAEYDLTTREGHLMLQVGSASGNAVKLRQDYTLPAGKSIVIALYASLLFDGDIVNNEIWFGFGLNDNDGDYDAGTWQGILYDANADGSRIICHGTVAATPTKGIVSDESLPVAGYGGRIYFRIHRSAAGTKYWYFVSFDGVTWVPLEGVDNSVTYDNIWIFCECKANFGDPVPIQVVDWIREGGSGVDPW